MMMPSKIKIGSQIWDVSEQSRKTAYDDEVFGYTSSKDFTIVLDQGLALGVKRVTLLHELMHAIRFTFGGSFVPAKSTTYTEWEHYWIGLYEEPLVMVLRDNPELVKFLIET